MSLLPSQVAQLIQQLRTHCYQFPGRLYWGIDCWHDISLQLELSVFT